MIKVTACGNIGQDAQVRTVNDKNTVTTFSIASNAKYKEKNVTTWLNCNKWNSDKLAPYLTKGTFVIVHGNLDIREHEGKYYTTLTVQELEFGGRSETKSKSGESDEVITPETYEPENPDDDLPF